MSHHSGRAVRRTSSAAGRFLIISFALILSSTLRPSDVEAQALPSGWTTSNVGSPALSGTASHTSGTFTIEGGGVDVWDPSDQFFFTHRQVTGDVTIVARVGSIENTNAWAKAGVMIRESLSGTSRHAFALVSPSKGIAFQRRSSTGGTSSSTSVTGTAPVWLRLERRGSSITASRSATGTSWTTIGTTTISMASTVYVGLAVTSHNPSARATGTFNNVTVGAPTSPLPTGWTAADVGAPSVRGSASYSGSTFTVSGAGADIWGSSDQFQYAYRQITGDVDVIARVASLQGPHAWSKAGVMVRASLSASSAHASLFTSVSRGVAFQRRPGTGLSSLNTAGGSGSTPVWLKLERRGSAITAFRSATGTSWTMIDSQTLTLPSTFYVGLAVTSHYTSAAATASFTNVTVTSGSSTQTPPTVSLTAPAAGATFMAPATVNVAANASDADNGIADVRFYANGNLIGTDTTSPYTATWSNVAAGTYSITAIARDNGGATTTSSARSIVVGTQTIPTRAVFEPSDNHATAVTSYRLDVFTAGANPATATPMATRNLGKPSVVNGECSVDIASTISGLPGGSYFATVVAIGPGGTSPRAQSGTFTR
jgi:regulation of enolase protein 1 (concanavalin A-like superfamily)